VIVTTEWEKEDEEGPAKALPALTDCSHGDSPSLVAREDTKVGVRRCVQYPSRECHHQQRTRQLSDGKRLTEEREGARGASRTAKGCAGRVGLFALGSVMRSRGRRLGQRHGWGYGAWHG
jgi:hypothetical protein